VLRGQTALKSSRNGCRNESGNGKPVEVWRLGRIADDLVIGVVGSETGSMHRITPWQSALHFIAVIALLCGISTVAEGHARSYAPLEQQFAYDISRICNQQVLGSSPSAGFSYP
jgi:hypothetical protein